MITFITTLTLMITLVLFAIDLIRQAKKLSQKIKVHSVTNSYKL